MDIRNDNALVLPVNTEIKLIVSNAAVERIYQFCVDFCVILH